MTIKFDDPAAVLTSAMAALNLEEFGAVVAHCDDNSVLLVAQDLVAILSDSALDDFRSYLAEHPIPSGGQPEDIALRDAATLLTAWIGWNSPREQIRRLVAAGQVAADLADGFCTPHPPPRPLEIVGVVPEGDHLAHVLHRLEGRRATPRDEVRIAQCCRSEPRGWLLVARRDMLGILTITSRLSRS